MHYSVSCDAVLKMCFPFLGLSYYFDLLGNFLFFFALSVLIIKIKGGSLTCTAFFSPPFPA